MCAPYVLKCASITNDGDQRETAEKEVNLLKVSLTQSPLALMNTSDEYE